MTSGVLGAELDAADVGEARDLATVAGLHHDLAELLGLEQAAEGVDRVLELDALRHRRLADAAGGHLHVLLAERLQHVAGGHVARGELLGIEPDAHAVVAGAEELGVADAGQTRQRVLHLDGGEVAEDRGRRGCRRARSG